VAQAYIIDQTPAKRRSTILGIYFFANMEGTGVLTPLLGYLIDHLGFYTTFTYSSAAIMAILAVCSAILWLTRR
jgi:MFS family permease